MNENYTPNMLFTQPKCSLIAKNARRFTSSSAASSGILPRTNSVYLPLYGSRLFCSVCAYVVRYRVIPAWLDPESARRYYGTVVITALDEATLLTTYQDPKHGCSQLKRKFGS